MRQGRNENELRPIHLELNYINNANGSVLISSGETKVICAATIEGRVPFFLKGKGSGWITAEYSMLPSSTKVRKTRDVNKGKIDGRSLEIQRLIGRSIRSCVDLNKLGEYTIWVDCDVIQADGGTRTASINGGFISTLLALKPMIEMGVLERGVIQRRIAAVSLGKINGKLVADMDYIEDSKAEVDLNIVIDDRYNIVEIQGTGEQGVLNKNELNYLINLAEEKAKEIFAKYDEVISWIY